MIISTQELMEKYKNYKVPKMKIKREIEKGTYVELKRGLYESNKDVEPMLLSGYLCGPSYLSFEYVLSMYSIIPEAVFVYTCATVNKRHTKKYYNSFGRYFYQDIPAAAFKYGIYQITQNGYSYVIASKEKALCDLLYTKWTVKNIKELKYLMFDDLRIDEEEFCELNMDDLLELSTLYKSTNLKMLNKYIKGVLKKYGKFVY